jgi:hypothetical protein
MVVTEKIQHNTLVTLHQLIRQNPAYINYVLELFELLLHQNEELKKIASRYSHDLRSPVTNINMLLQLYDRSENDADRKLYVHKISSSLERLQDGFEHLSADRKNSLRRDGARSIISLADAVKEIEALLPENILLKTDFDYGYEVMGIHKNLCNALTLLTAAPLNDDQKHTLQLSTAKSWDALQLVIKYPVYLNLTAATQWDKDEINKNNAVQTHIMGWNYYFALLFLGVMGATTHIDESEQANTTAVIISFT